MNTTNHAHRKSTTEADWYAEALAEFEAKDAVTEADVSTRLIRPVLIRILGFTESDISAEASRHPPAGRRVHPDFICTRDGMGTAIAIVEVENLAVNLTRRQDPQWRSSPIGQLHGYLSQHPQSVVGTWGIVTNGVHWVIHRRDAEDISPHEMTPPACAKTEKDVRKLLKHVIKAATSIRLIFPPPQRQTARWLDAIASCTTPNNFLQSVNPKQPVRKETSWSYQEVPPALSAAERLERPSLVACMAADHPDGYLSPSDIAQELGPLSEAETITGVAYIDDPESGRRCRGFVLQDDSLRTTALIDPALPGPRAQRQFEALASGKTKQALDALSAVPLHRRFHEEVGQWFARTEGGRNDLHHLIRVMFAWLLQERGVLPNDALWRPGTVPDGPLAVHEHITWLFSQVLATPHGNRESEHHDDWRSELVNTVPFLNGSLFSERPDDEIPTALQNPMYLGRDGLLSILGRYDWTLSDRTGNASETAIDPAMLGESSEQLVLRTDGVRIESRGNRKMPGGAYYTPQDLVEEMTADALGEWLCRRISTLEHTAARILVLPSVPARPAWKEWPRTVKEAVTKQLKAVTVFDPCCGSGAFTIAMLQALWRAKERLSSKHLPVREMEHIVENQLHAADIHPTAVLITRLRLFVALMDAQCRSSVATHETASPLPNLETRCMAVNALCMELNGQECFGGQAWDDAMDDVRSAREMWTVAHHPDEKADAIRMENEARERVKNLGSGWGIADDLGWLDGDFLSSTAPPAMHDVRKLFPAPKTGWDIVIGNPPYQRPDEADRLRGKQLGYAGYAANLYLMFIEAALHVVHPHGGCLTLVVPHSIVFHRNAAFQTVRRRIEAAAERIRIRTYDNTPQPAFPRLPWLKGNQSANTNRQRATVMTVLMGRPAPPRGQSVVHSTGLIRVGTRSRATDIRATALGQPQPAHAVQWTQAPTPELASLLSAMHLNTHPNRPAAHARNARSRIATFPRTAMYYITCLPENIVDNPRRRDWHLLDDRLFWPWIGLYNSRLFHPHWLMIGDAFDVTRHEISSVRAPPGWHDEEIRAETERLARHLIDETTIRQCTTTIKMQGKLFPSVNFHREGTDGPKLIRQLDAILLDAYGLPEIPLTRQMEIIRTGSAHRLRRSGNTVAEEAEPTTLRGLQHP